MPCRSKKELSEVENPGMIKIMWKEVTEMYLLSNAASYEFLSVCFPWGKGNNHGGLGGLVSSCVLVTVVSKWFV